MGAGFIDKARRIHAGEAEERPIYGEAPQGEAQALAEEGAPAAAAPWIQRRDD